MAQTLAFDVYGTLINTHGVLTELQSIMDADLALQFSQSWRDKQLEYSFRRGLMKQYQTFAVCTANALDYTDKLYNTSLSDEQKKSLLMRYRTLPAFDDVRTALESLAKSKHRLFAFSNGTAEAVETLLQTAKIRDLFEGVVSVDEIQSFKPNPAVYRHFLEKTQSQAENSWLISGNPFDVLGAMNSNMNAAWVKRSDDAIFDPWGIEPTVTISSLGELEQAILP